VNLDYQDTRARVAGRPPTPALAHLRAALDTLFAPFVFDGVDDRFEVMFRSPTGRVRLEALSDGYRSLFVIITELLLRCSLTTAPPESMLDVEGVCLIDEIDAHLHPRLQERALPALHALFPRMQIVATTHSPIVVAGVEPKNVFRLDDEPIG
jgi:predicted ATP-binding protein involved in virulence